MKSKINSHFLFSLFISFVLIACNSGEKKAEESSAGDTTAKEPAVTTTPAVTEETIDAVKSASQYYKLIADTLGIRVLEANYNPGDSSALHSHPVNALYVIKGGTAEFTAKDGSKMTMELKTGMTGIGGYDLHSVKNSGKTPMKVLLVEVNRPNNVISPDPVLDASKVAGDHYKVLNDSLGLRILEVNYKPGQSSALHAHPDYAAYIVEGGTGEITTKEGTKNTTSIKSGTSWVSASDSHSAKNVGKKSFKIILFEVNRARN